MHVAMKGGGPEIRVGKIVCVGRNYAAHIDEMNAPRNDRPVLFLKPATAIPRPGELLRLPAFSTEIHHEVELVALIGRAAHAVAAERALEHVAGYAVGLDLTARDLQGHAKAHGEPWAISKGFDGSAPLSEFRPAAEAGDVGDRAIELAVNGAVRQAARTSQMLFSVAELLAYASGFFSFEPGDLLFTGTPAGVGPIRPGDLLEATIEGVARARWRVAA